MRTCSIIIIVCSVFSLFFIPYNNSVSVCRECAPVDADGFFCDDFRFPIVPCAHYAFSHKFPRVCMYYYVKAFAKLPHRQQHESEREVKTPQQPLFA